MSTAKKSQASIDNAWLRRNSAQRLPRVRMELVTNLEVGGTDKGEHPAAPGCRVAHWARFSFVSGGR